MPLTDEMTRLNTQQADKVAHPMRTVVRERSHSDEVITVDSAVTVSGVIAIMTLIAQDTASLPLILYGKRGRNKFRATDHPCYSLLHDEPNSEHTAMTFREFIASHLIAWGNFYAQLIFDEAGVTRQLWPLRPDRMIVKRIDGERVYIYRTSDGKERVFLSDEILHIPGFGFDGLVGMSRIALARNAIGLAMSEEKYGSYFFKNGANSGTVIKHPGTLTDIAYNHLDESIKEQRQGIENSGKPWILEEGMSLDRLGIPNDDAQFLESRKFQLSEINRIIGPVPPHMIGDVTSSTSWGTGIDSQEQGYVNHTLRPYAIRTEQGLRQRLLLQEDRDAGYYFEHLFDAFLRGDIATRYTAYQTGINNGFLTRNEVRARENLNPRKGLDELLMPLNMTTIQNSDSSNGNGEESTDAAANALVPLWRDAIARVMKRESNDLQGASKRWQVKGQPDAFVSWAENFYRRDHAAFMSKQFKPLMDAQVRLFGVDISERMHYFIFDFLSRRLDQVKAMSADEIASTIDDYVDGNIDEFLSFVGDCFMQARTNMDEMEFEDEQ